MSLLTVIVPNYNHACFLQQRMDSILSQSFRDFEVIILDDHSTDNSREIIEAYRDHEKVKAIVYNENNSGSPFKQWAKGMAIAETEWIWIAESDDYCKAGFLASLQPAFSNKAAVLAYSEISWVDEFGNIIKPASESPAQWMEGHTFLRSKMLLQDWLVNAGMVVFRKDAVTNVAAGWQQMKQAGDYWFWCEIARQGNVYACGKALAYFVRHTQSLSQQHLYTTTHLDESMLVLDQVARQKIFSKKDINSYLLQQLVQLETGRKGLPVKEYERQRHYWVEVAAERGIAISSNEIAGIALWQKGKHFIRKK